MKTLLSLFFGLLLSIPALAGGYRTVTGLNDGSAIKSQPIVLPAGTTINVKSFTRDGLTPGGSAGRARLLFRSAATGSQPNVTVLSARIADGPETVHTQLTGPATLTVLIDPNTSFILSFEILAP